ncbi:MAG: acylphosphatase [Lachnospiraceae bacterium]|nr:acylphosphatase [Lachnospiraceae bacterium]
MIIRQHYIFKGEVQGVGFRYTAKYAAESLGLTGWVKNNWDGSVEMEVQGEDELVERMLSMIYSGRHIYINDIKKMTKAIVSDERSFHVRY